MMAHCKRLAGKGSHIVLGIPPPIDDPSVDGVRAAVCDAKLAICGAKLVDCVATVAIVGHVQGNAFLERCQK